jgi:hypothetical protein
MRKLSKTRKDVVPAPPKRRQISISFESSEFRGLSCAQRMKAVAQLSRVLMLAAGVALEESDDER